MNEILYGYIFGRHVNELHGSESHRIFRYRRTEHGVRDVECVAACPTFEAAVAAGALMAMPAECPEPVGLVRDVPGVTGYFTPGPGVINSWHPLTRPR